VPDATTAENTMAAIGALAALLPAAQRSARAYAKGIDLFSGAGEIEAAHPSGRAYVIATKLALIHSEVTEAVQEIRDRKTDLDLDPRPADDPLSAELADVILRTLELAEDLHVDLGAALRAKTLDTVSRYRHDGVRF
jgi:NTP pyrophosphatase (non-canonical NTP hydrolase)